MIYINNKEPEIYIGDKAVDYIYIGDKLYYSSAPIITETTNLLDDAANNAFTGGWTTIDNNINVNVRSDYIEFTPALLFGGHFHGTTQIRCNNLINLNNVSEIYVYFQQNRAENITSLDFNYELRLLDNKENVKYSTNYYNLGSHALNIPKQIGNVYIEIFIIINCQGTNSNYEFIDFDFSLHNFTCYVLN